MGACVATTVGTVACGPLIVLGTAAICIASTYYASSICDQNTGYAVYSESVTSRDAARRWCREQCIRIFEEMPEALPGEGRNMQPRLERCISARLERCISDCVEDVENGDLEGPS